MTHEAFMVGYPLPEETNINWTCSKPIRHFVIEIAKRKKGDSADATAILRNFQLIKREYVNENAKAYDVEGMSGYAVDLQDPEQNYPDPSNPQDLNIDVNQQCWIIIELEKDQGWEFSKNHPAITTKLPDKHFKTIGAKVKKYGFNANLRYVTKDGRVLTYEEINDGDKCTMVFFRVLYREAGRGRGMNIVIDALSIEGVEGRKIPIIIDPDVPDDGTQGFPNPP